MENNNLSNIWKSQADQEIKQYSISGLYRQRIRTFINEPVNRRLPQPFVPYPGRLHHHPQ